MESGAVEAGAVTELGELLDGRAEGRTDDCRVTVSTHIGTGVEDAAAAAAAALRALGRLG